MKKVARAFKNFYTLFNIKIFREFKAFTIKEKLNYFE